MCDCYFTHAIYRDCFSAEKIENFIKEKKNAIFNIFANNIDLTSTHNLCFGSKIGMPLYTPVLLHVYKKVGFKGYTCHGHVILMIGYF